MTKNELFEKFRGYLIGGNMKSSSASYISYIKELDEKIQEVKNLPSSRERSLAITKLQEAVMWLGMDLKRLNETNPYPSSKDPSTGDKIESTADGLKF
jgi:CHASE3 domain sensor protein